MTARELHAIQEASGPLGPLGPGNIVLSNRSIGAILVEEGRLKSEAIENILHLQFERNMLFGDAAVRLGYLTKSDVEYALARQFGYPYIVEGQSGISEELVAAYHPASAEAESLRALRNQLMLSGIDSRMDHRTLAITSADRGEGRSFLAANLAIMFSQQGQRTLLIDADMRHPRQHQLFNLKNRSGLSALLSDRMAVDAIQPVPPFSELFVMTAGSPPPNPLELAGRPAFAQMLREKAAEYDVILIDTPAGGRYADAQMIAMRADATLVVVRKDVSRVADTRRMVDMMSRSGVRVIGTALNEF